MELERSTVLPVGRGVELVFHPYLCPLPSRRGKEKGMISIRHGWR
jgi:hypothetical protein